MGDPDTTFCLFFRSSAEAAVLSCDHHGISSDELLHYPLASFIVDAGGDVDIGQLRYNLRERHRQKLFKLLFLTRKQIAESGRLRELWGERERLFPDAPGVPHISAIMAKGRAKANENARTLQEARGNTDLDTESEEDDLDELYRPKPKPAFTASSRTSSTTSPRRGQHNNSSRSGIANVKPMSPTRLAEPRPVVPYPPPKKKQPQQPSGNSSRAPSRGNAGQSSSVASLPHQPSNLPNVPRRNHNTLLQEGKLVRIGRQRLRKYAEQFAAQEPMVSTQASEVLLSEKNRPPSTPHVDIELPAVADAALRSTNELKHLINHTMQTIVEGSGRHQQYMSELQDEIIHERQQVQRGVYGNLRPTNPHASSPGFGMSSTTPSESSRTGRNPQWAQRVEDIRYRQLENQQSLEAKIDETVERKLLKAEEAEMKQRRKYRLHCEQGEVRRQIALEQKERNERARVCHLMQELARKEHRHIKAEQCQIDKKDLAFRNKQTHDMVSIFRTTLKAEQANMEATKAFDVPQMVQGIWDPETNSANMGPMTPTSPRKE